MTRHTLRTYPAIRWMLALLVAAPLLMARSSSASQASLYTIRQRFGVGLVTQYAGESDFPGEIADYAGAEDLGFGWYADWSLRENPPPLRDIEYAQMLAVEPWKSTTTDPGYLQTVRTVAEQNTGALWIVGNEPDHPTQGNCSPTEYAQVYHRAYHYLKGVDPTAQIAIGGIVMPSPLRLMWLEQCLQAYSTLYGVAMPVEIWNTHMQLLRENWWDDSAPAWDSDGCCYTGTWGCGYPVGLDPYDAAVRAAALSDLTSCDNADPVLFQQLIWAFREWLVEHGQGDKPLIISEYGVLMPDILLRGGADDVEQFMNVSFTFLLTATDPILGCTADGGRLVQRWLWYSLNGPLPEWVAMGDSWGWTGFNGSLYDYQHPDRLTRFGTLFQDYTSAHAIPRPYDLSIALIRSVR